MDSAYAVVYRGETHGHAHTPTHTPRKSVPYDKLLIVVDVKSHALGVEAVVAIGAKVRAVSYYKTKWFESFL